MKIIVLILMILGMASAQAATITAISGSYVDVNNAVSSSSSGDTIIIPAGTYIWTKTLTVSGVTIQGSGTNSTIIIDETPAIGNGSSLFTIGSVTTLSRITQIQITKGVTNTFPFLNSAGEISVYGTGNLFRIDHCLFYRTTGKPIHVAGSVYGLIDHCYFQMPPTTANAIEVNDDTYGDVSWATPYSYGTSNAVYVEDNYIFSENSFCSIDVANGGRAVIRYNTFRGGFLFVHGTDTGQRYRSGRVIEAYNNYITYGTGGNYDNYFAMFEIHGGTGIMFSNSGYGFLGAVGAQSFRAYDNDPGFTPWFGATGFSGYDSNSAVSLTGTATATSNVLVVASASWTANQWVGYTVYNTNPIAGRTNCGMVSSNTATTMSFSTPRSPANQIYFTNGDNFSVHYVYPQLDQVGRGYGALMSGGVPSATWPTQSVSMFYSWSNNVYQASNLTSNKVGEMFSAYLNVINGRDFTNTILAGYTPFIYPHPLTGTTNAPPTPPLFIGGLLIPLGVYGAGINFSQPAIYIDITNGLVAWYPLAGNVNDFSTNGNNGTAVGSPVYVNGVLDAANTALFFQTNQYVQSPVTNLAFASGTISWWMKPANNANSGTDRILWGQLNNGNSAPEFSAQVFLDNNFYVGWNSGSDARIVTAANSSNYQNGVWRFYTFTWNGAGSLFYVNGTQTASSASVPNPTNIGQKFNINQYSTTLITGSTDAQAGFRIYNRALTGVEVGTVYTNGINGGIF